MKRYRPKKYYEQTITPVKTKSISRDSKFKGKNLRAIMPRQEEDEEGDHPMGEEPLALAAPAGKTKPGRETNISNIPYSPASFPETQNWRCIYNKNFACRYNISSGTSPYYCPFDLDATASFLFRPNSPKSLVNTWYCGGGGPGTYDPDTELSFWAYWKSIYNHYTVLNTKIKIHIHNLGETANNNPYTEVLNITQVQPGPKYILFEEEYSKVSPTSDEDFNQLLDAHRVGKHPFYDQTYNEDSGSGIVTREQTCQLTKEYNHGTWSKLVDIVSDSEDQIWTAVADDPARPHWVRFKPVPQWNPRNTNNTYKIQMIYSIRIEMDIQFKELNGTFLHGYHGTPSM